MDGPVALTVLSPAGRRDVVVGPGARIDQLSAALALTTPLRTLDGAPLAPQARVGEVLTSGAWVVAPAAPSATRADRGATRPALGLSLRPDTLAWGAAALIGLALVPRLVDLGQQATAQPALAVGSGMLALVLALLPPRRVADAVTVATWFAGALCGLFTVASAPVGGLTVPVTTALVAATIASSVRMTRLAGQRSEMVVARVLLLVGGTLALVGIASIAMGRTFPVALLLGLAPAVLRALPPSSVEVPEPVLLDPEPSQRTANQVREADVAAPVSVRRDTVRSVVDLGQRRRRALTVLLASTTAILAVTLALTLPSGSLELAATAVLSGLVGLGLALLARRDREGVLAWSTRLAGAVALAPLVAVLAHRGQTMWVLVVAAVVAALALALAPALGRQWRSLWWSRLADTVESAAVMLAPPLGVVASGAVAAMMLMAAG